MSVLETVTVDNVTYDMHDPKVGSGTLSTTAQTLIPAVNEVKSGLTTVSGKTDIIGSGSLNTTSQTLIGAVNEVKATADANTAGKVLIPQTTFNSGTYTSSYAMYKRSADFTLTKWTILFVSFWRIDGSNSVVPAMGTQTQCVYWTVSSNYSVDLIQLTATPLTEPEGIGGYRISPWVTDSSTATYSSEDAGRKFLILPPGTYYFISTGGRSSGSGANMAFSAMSLT